MPEAFESIQAREEEFGVTIQRKLSVRQLADKGTPYDVVPPFTDDRSVWVRKGPIGNLASLREIGPQILRAYRNSNID